MAVYNVYRPGPTVAEQYNSVDEAWLAFLGDIFAEIIGSIGGSGSETWYLSALSGTGGANPEWVVTYTSVGGLHTANYRIRWNPVLLGTLDPSYILAGQHVWPQHVLSIPYSAFADWVTRLGAAGVTNLVAVNMKSALAAMTASGDAAFSGSGTHLVYTDGARAGGRFGIRCTWSYNPSAAELSAGTRQMEVTRIGLVTDADNGTINVAQGAAVIGEATANVPVIQFQGDEAAQAWIDFNTTVQQSYLDFSVTSINIVTNTGDLGQPGATSKEPAPAEVSVDVFANPGVLPAIINNTLPAIQTTLPAQLLTMLALVAEAMQKTLPIISAIAAKAVEIANAPGIIATAQAAQAIEMASIANSLDSIATDLSAIRPAIIPPDPDALPAGSLVDQLKRLKDAMQAQAETRNYIHLRHHGVEVQAESGALLPEVP